MQVFGSLLFTVLACSSVGFFLFHLKKLWFSLSEVAQGVEESRLDNPLVRFRNVFLWGGLQGRMFKDLIPAVMHFIIFWGFITVSLGTIETLFHGIFPSFSMKTLLGESFFFRFYLITQDTANFLVALAILFAVARRIFFPPARFKALEASSKKDALIILGLIGGLVLTTLVALGATAHTGDLIDFSQNVPFSFLVSSIVLFPLSSTEGWETAHSIFWWAHSLILFSFMIYLPFSKHQHLIWVWPNMFFKHFKSTGRLRPMKLSEEMESFGVGNVKEFTWKQLLDSITCVECGRCTSVCPAASTGKKLDPRMIVLGVKKAFKEELNQEIKEKRKLTEDIISAEELWDCTTCGACMEACPLHIEHIPTIVDMRRYLTMTEGRIPDELQTTLTNLENQGNPWGFSNDKREDWFKGLDVSTMREKSSVDYLLWVGCAGAFDQRYQKVSQSLAKVLNQAGVSYSVLGKEETCNGDTARRAGNEYLANMQIEQNVETFKRYGIKKVITPCPHCFNTFKNEYEDFGLTLEVKHHSEMVAELLEAGKITPNKTTESVKKATFHDSCYLGRHNKVYSAPRKVLESIQGLESIEMPRNKEKGFCCGAGGARMWLEETKGKKINIERAEEALATGADTVATGCPFCLTMMTDGVQTKDESKKVQVKDLVEILGESL